MIGARVMGLWSNGSWYPGMVSQTRERRGEPQYFVQFDDGDTAWLTADKIQVQSAPGAAAYGEAPTLGARVMGDWTENSWYPGYVCEANPNGTLFFVQFDDGDTKWLAPSKIRPNGDRPAATATPQLTPGTAVQGEWADEAWYPGVVARVNDNATMFFIQFDDGDQKWLPSHQLRYTAAARSAQPAVAQHPQPAPHAAPVHAAPPSAPHGAPAHAAHPPAPMAAPRAESELRCAYCNLRITRSDVSRCPECGARL